MGSGLRRRKVEKAVSDTAGRPRKHVLHRSKQLRKACYQSPRHDGSTTGKRRGPVVFHSAVRPQHQASQKKKTSASESHCGAFSWEHSEQIGPV